MYKSARALVLKTELGLSKEEKQKESRLLPSVLHLLKCTCKKNHKYSQKLGARSTVQQPMLCITLSQLPAEATGGVTRTVRVFTPSRSPPPPLSALSYLSSSDPPENPVPSVLSK